MSSTQENDPRVVREQAGLRGFFAGAASGIAQGDIGQLPVIVGLVAIAVIFQVVEGRLPRLVQPGQPDAPDGGDPGRISIGVVLILLLGEIDLTAGIVSGLCAAVMAVLSVNMRCPAGRAAGQHAHPGTAVELFKGFWITRFGIRRSSSRSPG